MAEPTENVETTEQPCRPKRKCAQAVSNYAKAMKEMFPDGDEDDTEDDDYIPGVTKLEDASEEDEEEDDEEEETTEDDTDEDI